MTPSKLKFKMNTKRYLCLCFKRMETYFYQYCGTDVNPYTYFYNE